MCLLDQALTLQCLRLDPDIVVSQTRSEFGAFKPVSVLRFDNSLKPVLKLVTVWYYKNKQIVLNQFLFFIDIDPISTHFWCESYIWPYIDNMLHVRVQCFGLFRNYNLFQGNFHQRTTLYFVLVIIFIQIYIFLQLPLPLFSIEQTNSVCIFSFVVLFSLIFCFLGIILLFLFCVLFCFICFY